MMSSATLRLVLLIACGHVLVHVYELSLPSVEQLIADEFSTGREFTGLLGSAFRWPYGLLALLAGWLADRYGARRLLIAYVLGGSLTALAVGLCPGRLGLSLTMFAMGAMASIYHPAGTSLISQHTTVENRTKAMGWHGIMGSAGIGLGPFMAGAILSLVPTWREYYLVLTLPGLLLAVFYWWKLPLDHPTSDGSQRTATVAEDVPPRWGCYATLLVFTCLGGVVYSGVLQFLPRYLDEAGVQIAGAKPESVRNYCAGLVMLLGIVGQYMGGHLARPKTLEPMLATAFLAAAPCLLWMGLAEGVWRLVAAGLFAPLYFMHQPLYNSLLPRYVPRRRRSLAYGLSFAVGLGIGGTGAAFAGWIDSDLVRFGSMAAMLVVAAMLALLLWHRNRVPDDVTDDGALV
jgi:MFS transporter, FSR family, fosmidomycin resistance protein